MKTLRLLCLPVLLITLAAGVIARPVLATDIPDLDGRLIGHPTGRFPLTVYAEPTPAKAFSSAIHDAVTQWNLVFEEIFHRAAFTWTSNQSGADILIRFPKSIRIHHEMGATDIDADKNGVIRLPVRIDLNLPKARGATDARQMLFDVTAHELGHALGLPHINNANSIMCCEPGGINFKDPAVRRDYIESRRHPDLRSVAPELSAHYRKFWHQNGSPITAP